MNVWYESVTVTCTFEFQLSYLAVESVDSGKPLIESHGIITTPGESRRASSFFFHAEFYQPLSPVDASFDPFDEFLECPGKPFRSCPKVLLRFLGSSIRKPCLDNSSWQTQNANNS
jgi:hypothetical protein